MKRENSFVYAIDALVHDETRMRKVFRRGVCEGHDKGKESVGHFPFLSLLLHSETPVERRIDRRNAFVSRRGTSRRRSYPSLLTVRFNRGTRGKKVHLVLRQPEFLVAEGTSQRTNEEIYIRGEERRAHARETRR